MESNTYKQTISLNAESADSNTYSHTSSRGTSFKSKSMNSKKKGRANIRNAQAGNTSRNDTSIDNNKSENLGKISSSASFRKRLKEKSRFIVSSEEIGTSKVKKNTCEKSKKPRNVHPNKEGLFNGQTSIGISKKRKNYWHSQSYSKPLLEKKKSRKDTQNSESEGSEKQPKQGITSTSENIESKSSRSFSHETFSTLKKPNLDHYRPDSPVMNLDIAGSFGLVRYGELSDGFDMAQRSENEYEDFSEGFDDNLNEAMEYDEANDAVDLDEYNDEDQEHLESHMFETSFSGLNRLRGVSGVSTRLKSILRHLKCYREPSVQLAALQKLAEIFSIATEDTLTKYFSCDPFIKELVNLMKGTELRNEEENSETMLLACRCLSNLIEALPSALSNVVYNGAVSTLCSKLMEIQYIDLAEQALSALERISVEYPTSIIREGGLVAVLSYLDFFSTNVQRTAVTTVANCSRNVPKEYFGAIKEVIPMLKRLLSYSDQKIVEQACLALVRLVESFKYNTKYLESIVTEDLTQNILDLISSPTSSIVSPYIYTKLLTLIRHSAKGSSNLTSELLQDNIIEVLYQVLTGSVFRNNEPNHLKSDSVALTKLLNRPSDQVCEALGIAIELLPHLPKEIITAHRKDSNCKKKGTKSNYDLRMRLLEKYPDTMTKFSEILLPTLIEVFSSNVVIEVRLRVITTLLKIVYYAKEEVLVRVLKDVPFAGFIAAILSCRDHLVLVVGAVQLAELLMDRLPDIYHLLFYREGVIDEVVRLSDNISISESSDELSEQSIPDERLNDLFEGLRRFRKQVEYNASKQSAEQSDSDENNESGALYKRETNLEAHSSQSSQIPRGNSRTRIKSEKAFGGMRAFERISISLDSRYLGRSRGEEVKAVDDIRKWLHMESSIFRTNYIDNIRQSKERNLTKGIFSNLQELALQLKGDIIDPLAVDTLVALTEFLKITEESVTSFEFLQSGLMENLLEYLTNPHYSLANLSKRQLAFLEIFVGGTHASLTEMDRVKIRGNVPKLGAFSVLVEKLQQSLTQLEPFEVALSYQNSLNEERTSTAMLTSQINLELNPEENLRNSTDYSSLEVSIHAIATFKALGDYLKSRIVATSLPSRLGRSSSSRFTNPFIIATGLDLGDSDENNELRDISDSKKYEYSECCEGMEINEESDSSDMGIDEDVAYVKQIGIGNGKMTRAMTNDPQDNWHFEFSIGDVAIDNEWTVYKAIHQYIQQSTDKSRNRWSSIYAIKYKKVYDSPKNLETLQSQSSSFGEAAACTGYYNYKNVYSQILRLLRELHTLNTRCLEIHSQTSVCEKSLAVLQPSNFINVKLTAKMNRQLEEPMIVVNSCLPNWCEYLTKEYSFLFPFETRYLYLQSTAFGCSRSIARYQNRQARSNQLDSRRDDLQPVLGRIQRQKVRISRPRILESAVKVMDLYGSLPSILEVEYFEEVGTGLGPTLEFYAAVSKEFCKRSLTLWRDDGDPSTSGSYATSSQGLFPRPRSELYFESENGIRILNLYKAMGKFVAKALFDTRIIDLPLNSIFLKAFLNPEEKIQTLSDIRQVDSGIVNSLEVISYFAREKQRILQDFTLSEVQRQKYLRRIKYQGASLEDICLDCTLPGYPDIELTENGANTPVNIQNVEEYLDAVIEYTVGSGVTKQIEAFRSGFDTVFSSKHLKAFSADELVMLFGQAEEDWAPATLLDAIRADHGYTPDSLSIKYLIEIMSSFTSKERREFLRFVTGSPKLPIGGFKSLTPRLTVVCKPNELPLTPDDYLPSVMTCVNYLKMPNYTSQDVMKSKLETAMKEGQGSFHLS